jgi:hypothetical protein
MSSHDPERGDSVAPAARARDRRDFHLFSKGTTL